MLSVKLTDMGHALFLRSECRTKGLVFGSIFLIYCSTGAVNIKSGSL